MLCFCCYHFRKLIDFSTLYGIYRRYGCLSKCTKKRLTCPQPTHDWFDWLVFCFEWVHGFYLVKYAHFCIYFESRAERSMEVLKNISFEGLPETSEDGLTVELSAFESLYDGQFELSAKLIKRKLFCYTLHRRSTIVFTLTFSSVH